MAKKKVQSEPEEQPTIEAVRMWSPDTDEPIVVPYVDPLIVEGEPMYRVSFSLPRAVLIALLEADNPLADVDRAYALNLLYPSGFGTYALTPLGKLVIDGTDVTALRHKMAAAWRDAHNRDIDGVKG